METFKFDERDIFATGALFTVVVLVFAILSELSGYPHQGEWQYAITLAFGISALPLVPRLLSLLKSSASSIDIAGIKIDFASVQGLPSFTLDANVVDPGVPIHDSGAMEVTKVARLIRHNPVLVVDLKVGQSWYLTRLFAIAASGIAFGTKQNIVFLHLKDQKPRVFLGFADAAVIAEAIMEKEPEYKEAFKKTLAAYHQLAAFWRPDIRPTGLQLNPDVDRNAWSFEGPASFTVMLMQELTAQEDGATKPWIDATRVGSLFSQQLTTRAIDLDVDGERAVSLALSEPLDNVAIVRGGIFEGVVPTARIMRNMLRQLATQPK